MNTQLAYAAVARFLRGVAVVFLVVTSVFILSRATGDPISYLAPIETTSEQIEEYKDQLGLNDPLIVQYGRFLAEPRSSTSGPPSAPTCPPSTW